MTVLYRKYRPKTFSEIVGQKHIVETLTNAVAQQMVAHAYLFYGPRGTGKTSTARLLAKSVNCENRKEGESEPCNKCSTCIQINEGRALDLVEVDAASNRGIDEIRSLRDEVNVVPVKSKYKVYILDECHELTKDASNALLKTLEEPPEHVIFILCTTEFFKVLPTIASRCQKFEFKKANLDSLLSHLYNIAEEENVKIEKEGLEVIARAAGGSTRDSLSLLNGVINMSVKGDTKKKKEAITKEQIEERLGVVALESVSQLIGFIAAQDKKSALKHIDKVHSRGIAIEDFLRRIVYYLRDLLLVKINPKFFDESGKFTQEEKNYLQQQEKQFSQEYLRRALSSFLESQNKIRWSETPQLILELAVVEAIEGKE